MVTSDIEPEAKVMWKRRTDSARAQWVQFKVEWPFYFVISNWNYCAHVIVHENNKFGL